MEGRDERDPGYDDWFDEPEPPTETQSGVARGVYEDADEVWVLPEEEDARASTGHREVVVAGRTLTLTQLVIIVACLLAIVFAILAAAGVFNGSTPAPSPVTITTTPTTTANTQTTTTAITTNTTPAPEQTLAPGDTGSQVKTLQRALTSLGFTVAVDGDYGTSTQAAVERFQTAKGLQPDGVVGPQTLAALQRALAAQ
jgi:Putative peptidoglycan binding domain